jgi:uncharacterized lipoprotein YajG
VEEAMKNFSTVGVALLAMAGCSFGDRLVHLSIDRPAGDPALPRGISVVLETPEDLRPEPHEVVGAVRSAVGLRTADISTEDDVREWIRQAMAQELQHAGFLLAPSGKPGRALRVETRIRVLSAEEGIGFGAKLSLDLRIVGDRRTILEKTYEASDHHVVITKTSGDDPADALRACLKKVVSGFVKDLVAIVESAPD